MPLIDQYAKEAYLRVLLQGPSGTGKTTTACQFPRPWVFDCDMNLAGALRWLRLKSKPLPVGYDIIDRDDAGKEVPENQRMDRLVKCVNAVINNPDVDTLVIDGGTKVSEYLKADVLRRNPTKTGGFEMPSWGFYGKAWVSFVAQLTLARKHIVFIFHEKIDKDELDGGTRFFLNLQGQFQGMAGSMFTDVWRAEVNAALTPKGEPEYVLRTAQNFRVPGLKNGLGLPAEFKFDWKIIQDKLDKDKTHTENVAVLAAANSPHQ